MAKKSLKEKVLDYLPKYRDEFERMIKADKEAEEKKEELDLKYVFWDYGDCRVSPQTLSKFFKEGILDLPFGVTGSQNRYCLADRGTTIEALQEYEPPETGEDLEPVEDVEIDLSVFDKVIEVREKDKQVKEVMQRAAKKPGIHVALIGGPGTGKSLIASCIEESTRSSWISATDMTKASLRDELIQTRPRFVLLDELDKFSSKEPVQLLSEPLSDQTLTVQTSGKEAERLDMPINAFATGNTFNFPSNIRDRFLLLKLPEYSNEEFAELLREGFPKNENIPLGITKEIIEEAKKRGIKSYRRCQSVGQMAESPGDVGWIFNTFDWEE